ncbi:MAG: hypothetical protein ABI559_00885 [Chloroflexota bacterium]
MPPYSTLRDFIGALTTGDTNITRVLERVTNNEANRQKYLPQVEKPGAFNGPIPEWICTEFRQAGMSQAEIEHIQERWPDSQKETVRAQLYEAWTQKRPIHFSWELFDGDDPRSEVRRDSNQEMRVVFRSPRRGVKITSKVRIGELKVDI